MCITNTLFMLLECARRRLVSKVGKPVLVRQGGQAEGGWGRDCFRKAFNATRSFVTLDSDPNTLLEFVNGKLAKRHALPYPFRGNSHVVYNNVFYYHQLNTRSLVRYDLQNKTSAALDIDDVAFGRSSRLLYSTRRSHVDVMADENGLWAVYASEKSTNTMVLKFDESSMKVERVWNLTLDHRQVGEMFIVCGVLYALGGVTESSTRVELAFDLYLEQMLVAGASSSPLPKRPGVGPTLHGSGAGSGEVNLSLSNPYRNTTMISYNPAESGLHSWDHGHQLYYPLLFTQYVQQVNIKRTLWDSWGRQEDSESPARHKDPKGARKELQTGHDDEDRYYVDWTSPTLEAVKLSSSKYLQIAGQKRATFLLVNDDRNHESRRPELEALIENPISLLAT
ncbi:hypothetical protein BIW11_10423 [Tropilaelaps mercedesae]|uniref:Olfactomedin-like domain-containing protein n=1 Tax=Tropilaelaps mercedesae TaxID=418985 RepID=A0A1V9XFR2_9ACAR|nr:hypothetical protein BIW11_10423 [Tropilaelaps mercedesae]